MAPEPRLSGQTAGEDEPLGAAATTAAQTRLGAEQAAGLGEKTRADGRVVLAEDEAEAALAFALPAWRKWSVLVMILAIQTSMNSNASMYGFAVDGLADKYGVGTETARLGQMAFLVAYAFGCGTWLSSFPERSWAAAVGGRCQDSGVKS